MRLPAWLEPAWLASEPHISPVATWALAVELVFWWHEIGRRKYGRQYMSDSFSDTDLELRALVVQAVWTVGGWRVARALMQRADLADAFRRHDARPVRAIRLEDE